MLTELAGAVRAGTIHPRELVERALARIEAVDGPIGAVVALRAEAALAEADGHDRQGPLAGIPFLVKDLGRLAGLPTTYGSRLHADDGPDDADDAVVARLRAAGAIPVGKTNTPEFGWTAVTSNLVFGTTANPWNPQRSPGGSSGGSAAALAAGLVPVATTSDGGGSVRIPASLCGLVGYKPTIGAIGREGAPSWIDFSTAGATGRTVADAVAEAAAYLGPVPGDVLALPAGAISLEVVRPRRALLCRRLRGAVDPVVDAAVVEAARAVEALGIPVEEVEDPIPDAVRGWLLAGHAELAQSLAADRDRWDLLDPGLRAGLERAAGVTLEGYIAARRQRYEVCAAVDRLLGDDAVLLTPTVNSQSWPAAGPMPLEIAGVRVPAVAVNTMDFNVSGHPAVSVPVGRDDFGVPIGLQAVAPRWRDGLALGLAAALEQARPWPLVAAGHEPFDAPWAP